MFLAAEFLSIQLLGTDTEPSEVSANMCRADLDNKAREQKRIYLMPGAAVHHRKVYLHAV